MIAQKYKQLDLLSRDDMNIKLYLLAKYYMNNHFKKRNYCKNRRVTNNSSTM